MGIAKTPVPVLLTTHEETASCYLTFKMRYQVYLFDGVLYNGYLGEVLF